MSIRKKISLIVALLGAAATLTQVQAETGGIETIHEVTPESAKENLLIYDEHHIVHIGKHNHGELYKKSAHAGNSTIVLMIYARK